MEFEELFKLEEEYEEMYGSNFIILEHVPVIWSLLDTDTKIRFFKRILDHDIDNE